MFNTSKTPSRMSFLTGHKNSCHHRRSYDISYSTRMVCRRGCRMGRRRRRARRTRVWELRPALGHSTHRRASAEGRKPSLFSPLFLSLFATTPALLFFFSLLSLADLSRPPLLQACTMFIPPYLWPSWRVPFLHPYSIWSSIRILLSLVIPNIT